MEEIAIIIYGDGGELGNFEIFANSLRAELAHKYSTVEVHHVNRDLYFFELLEAISTENVRIAELHIFSHAIGAGLFLGYKDPAVAARRQAIYQSADDSDSKVTYRQAVATEVGAIQTDDFRLGSIQAKKNNLRTKFSPRAFIKIWGCNSGVSGWVYSDGSVVDPDDDSTAYYWRAFNEFNVPKPSIAKAFAMYFGVRVFGANSGASIEVKHKNSWISSQQYKVNVGQWPSGSLPHRLVPDRGSYNEFSP